MESASAPLSETQSFKLNLAQLHEARCGDDASQTTTCTSSATVGSKLRSGAPLTHDTRKRSRQLKTELHSVTITTRKMLTRIEHAQTIVKEALQQLTSTAKTARDRLDQNPRMVRSAHNGDNVQRPIVVALENLARSCERSVADLLGAEEALAAQANMLQHTITELNDQSSGHEQALNSSSAGLAAALDDRDTHACIAEANAREETARAVSVKALSLAADAASKLQARRSAVQLSVRTSRDNANSNWKAQKTGQFGSSTVRETNPATRKIALNPESKGHGRW